MAIGNIVLGTATGKIGPLVMYHDGGQQITRTNSGKNGSRTYAQLKQRIRFCNPSLFYRLAHNAFFRFAFDDQRPNESEYNCFMRHNLMNDTVWLTKDEMKRGVVMPNKYYLSTGPLDVSLFDDGYHSMGIHLDFSGYPFRWKQVWNALKSAGLEIKQGDMLTGVSVLNGDYYETAKFDYGQLIVDFNDNTLITKLTEIKFGSGTWQISKSSLRWYYDFFGQGAVILSRRTENGVICSDSRIIINNIRSQQQLARMTPEAMHAAIDSFGYQEAILNPKQNE